MRLPYDLIVFDLECNQPSGKIIEIGAVRLTRNFEIRDEFQTLVNPNEPITNDIIELCKLNEDDLASIASADSLEDAGTRFHAWATKETKNVVLASWGNFDVTELHSQWKGCPFRRKAVDIKSIALWELARYGLKSTNSLSSSLTAFGIVSYGVAHRAVYDALNTARLLQAAAHKQKHFKETLLDLIGPLA